MTREIFDSAVKAQARPHTLESKLLEALYNHGLFENQAKQVMDALKASPANESMRDRWQDRADGYPPQLFNVLWLSASAEAVEWIDKNAPQHWARGMFTNEPAPPPKPAP